MNVVNKIKGELGEVRDAYRGLEQELARDSPGHKTNWASKLAAGAMAPISYAIGHLTGIPDFYTYEKQDFQSRRKPALDDPPGESRLKPKANMGGKNNKKKGVKKFVKKEVKKDLRKIAKAPKRGTRYRAVSAYRPAGRSKRGGKRPMFQIGQSKTRVFLPPTAVGFTRSQTNGFSFGRGRRPGCLKMHGKQYLGSIASVNDGANTWVVLSLQDKQNTGNVPNTVNLVTQFQVMPQNSRYFANPVFNMAQMFERYNMKTRMEFKSIVGTGTPGTIKLAYYDDPMAFFTQTAKTGWGTAAVSFAPLFADAPTAADMSSIQHIRESSVWKSFMTGWSYSGPNQEMQYVPATSYSNIMDYNVTSPIDLRQSIEGTWILGSTGITSSAGQGVTTNLGELWIHYELELCDIMSAAPVTGISAIRAPFSHAPKMQPSDGILARLARLELMQPTGPLTDKEYNHLIADEEEKKGYESPFMATFMREEKSVKSQEHEQTLRRPVVKPWVVPTRTASRQSRSRKKEDKSNSDEELVKVEL